MVIVNCGFGMKSGLGVRGVSSAIGWGGSATGGFWVRTKIFCLKILKGWVVCF